jgi:hypothetical protein
MPTEPKKVGPKQSKDWAFTDYDVSEERKAWLLELDCQYIVFQLEICPKSQRPHLQGFVQFKKRLRRPGVNRAMESKMHVGSRWKTVDEAADYCKKEESRAPGSESGPWESGTRQCQGNRKGEGSKLDAIQKMILEGKSAEEIADVEFTCWARNHRSIDRYIKMKAPKRDEETETDVICYWGDTRTGKSRAARAETKAAGLTLYNKPGGMYWDGYKGEDVVLVDDFRGNCTIEEFLTATDRYHVQVPFKGGFHNLTAKKMIYTSNLHPKEWWPKANERSLAAIMARFSMVKHFGDHAFVPAAVAEFVSAD